MGGMGGGGEVGVQCLLQFLSTLFFEPGYIIESRTLKFSKAERIQNRPVSSPPLSASFHFFVESHANLEAVYYKQFKVILVSFSLDVTQPFHLSV